MINKKLKKLLDYHYKSYNKNIFPEDPLKFPHRFNTNEDIEIAALIASTFAFGSVPQINNSLEKLFSLIENQPHEFVQNYNFNKDKKIFKNFRHRFISGNDTAALFYALNKIYKYDESLKNFFMQYYFEEDKNLKESISFFSKNMNELFLQISNITLGLKFMFPNPNNGSACKRMNLFLRWMIRKDKLDFGLWNEIPPSKLIIPVDTHIARQSKLLKLTKLSIVNWKMAEEITESLRKFNSDDPVKYDFSLCHIGMQKRKITDTTNN